MYLCQYECSFNFGKERTYYFRIGLASKLCKLKIIKIENVGKISLANNPFIIRLKNENEDINDLLKLTPDQLLLRWFNWHLKNAGHNRTVNNFTSDIKDGENYTILLN